MMQLYYECSDGTIIDFMSGDIAAQEPETLLSSSWDYSTISGVNGMARIKRFYKEIQESDLELMIMSDDAEHFNATMDKLHRCFDRDIRTMRAGRIWWNDFYKEVFIVASDHEDFEEFFEAVTKKVKVVSVRPYWVRSKTYSFGAIEEYTGALDYPHDYNDFDYDRDEVIETIECSAAGGANFEIRFYGPCTNPGIIIAGHQYQVYDTLTADEYIAVTSTTKKVMKYNAYGETENIFHLRGQDDYIFQPIPEGLNTVIRDKTTKADVIIYEERGEPTWI